MNEQIASSSESELQSLMIAAIRGDAVAYRTLLHRLSGHLRAYFKGRLSRVGRGPAEAEDLVQEALIAMHTRRHTYDPAKPFTPWVYAIARYKLIDHLRRMKLSSSDISIEDAPEIVARDDRASVESSLDLQKLLMRLPAKMRQAIQDVKVDELSVNEAATRSGMSESAIKMSVHRGLKALAELVQRRSKP
ncbi:MAG TPA: sigma-70 family RNA polymerase sigma factor [Candidatus Angelobacter sp.]|nr:sigma-70 family RNA polymerase sigma factor [Candidatus Angelobacter sp.]